MVHFMIPYQQLSKLAMWTISPSLLLLLYYSRIKPVPEIQDSELGGFVGMQVEISNSQLQIGFYRWTKFAISICKMANIKTRDSQKLLYSRRISHLNPHHNPQIQLYVTKQVISKTNTVTYRTFSVIFRPNPVMLRTNTVSQTNPGSDFYDELSNL